MNNTSQPNAKAESAEISLIDLLVLVIKRRRIIAGLTILCALVAGLYYVAFPLMGIREITEEYTVEMNIMVPGFPSDIQTYLNFQAPQVMMAALGEVRNISSVYRETQQEFRDPGQQAVELTETELLRREQNFNIYIRDRVMKNMLSVQYSEQLSTVTILFSYRNSEFAESFLKILEKRIYEITQRKLNDAYEQASRRLAAAESRALLELETMLTSVLSETPNVTPEQVFRLFRNIEGQRNLQAVFQLAQTRHLLDSLLDSSQFPWSPGSEIMVYVETEQVARDGIRRTILIVFVVLFLSVICALILEFAEFIKNDPIESRKIQDAWNYPKKKTNN